MLGLYLYADGKELRLHDPETGMLQDLEAAQRSLADTQRSLEQVRAARAEAEARAAALEVELEALRRRS